MDDMLTAHPLASTLPTAELRTALDALLHCASTCSLCADACLNEEHVAHMTTCIALDEQCATSCFSTAQLLSRPTTAADTWSGALRACAELCRRCADECARHADMQHCVICDEACRACADACDALLAASPISA